MLIRCLQDDTEDPSPPGSPTSIPNDDPLAANPDLAIVESSKSAKIIQDALQSIYEPMEIWYLRTSIDKVRLDTPRLYSILSPPTRHARYLLPTLPFHRSRRRLLPPQDRPSPPHFLRFPPDPFPNHHHHPLHHGPRVRPRP
jgi:hypothetical protein